MKNAEERRNVALGRAIDVHCSGYKPEESILDTAKQYDRFLRTGKTPKPETTGPGMLVDKDKKGSID